MSRRILLTGAHGFIGSHLTRRLVAGGHDVGIICREQSDTGRIADIIDDIEILNSDIRDLAATSGIVSSFAPDVVIHLATSYAVEHTPAEIGAMMDTNVKATVNLIDSSARSGAGLFINVSTCAVYKDTGRKLSETDRLAPQNLYALTKLHSEEACSFYSSYESLPCTTLRLFPPYGPSDNARRLLPYLIRCYQDGVSPDLTTGKQKWDFVYVEDIVDAFVLAFDRGTGGAGHEIYNVGTGEPIAVRDVVESIKSIMGVDEESRWGALPHRKNEVWYNSADIERIGSKLGWKPSTSIEDGLKKTVEWFTSSRE